MIKQSNESLDEIVNQCALVLPSKNGRYRKFPIEIKLKVSRLHESGISVRALSSAIGIPLVTIYSWIKAASRKNSASSIRPKRLRIKPLENALPRANFDRVHHGSTFGRLIFKSDVQLEIPFESIDRHFLNILNEIGN